ncbi:gamma-glutamylcyclotransferase family protein [Jatrophihabitans sp. DSM 45814]
MPEDASEADNDTADDGAADIVRLFSYGTLQQEEVQRANFGRELPGRPDSLPGHRMSFVEITDAEVVALSGSALHPIVRRSTNPDDVVEGTVFVITPDELAAADEYEVDDYGRVLVTLGSGDLAWVYLAADELT